MMMLIVCLTVFLISGTRCAEMVEKGFLLSDPQYIQQVLTRFQSEIQELQVKLNTQQEEGDNLRSMVTQLQHTALIRNDPSNQQRDTTSQFQTNGGSVFTRWGRTDCPTGKASLVYTGFAGGSMYRDTGAAAEYLCMPSVPVWGPHKNLPYDGPNVGYVYGAEYEDGDVGVFGMMDSTRDVPCAVCVGSQFTSSLMIPGRTQCYPGWTEAYHGVLSSGAHSVAASTQYVCVDQQPQSLDDGAERNEDGKLFYGVKSKCGSLHCPPYEDNKFLSCVVCLK